MVSHRSDTAVRPSAALDDVGKQLIEQLQEDGRRSYASMARAVGLSEVAVRQRVQRLLQDGIIQIAAVTDAAAVGFQRQALVGVKVEGEIGRVADKLVEIPEADYVVLCAGQFDVLLELVCEDDNHLLRVVDRIRSVPGVRATETFIYLKLAKETYSWGTR